MPSDLGGRHIDIVEEFNYYNTDGVSMELTRMCTTVEHFRSF